MITHTNQWSYLPNQGMVRKPNITITRGKLLGAVTGAVVLPGQFLVRGSYPPGAVVPLGQLSVWAVVPWAVVAWAVVGASLLLVKKTRHHTHFVKHKLSCYILYISIPKHSTNGTKIVWKYKEFWNLVKSFWNLVKSF